MTVHSGEDGSPATAFAGALRSLIALSASGERRVWPSPDEVLAATPTDLEAPASLVRLLQFAILPELLGESAGPAMHLAAKRCAARLGITSVDELTAWFAAMHLGELEVEVDERRILVKLRHCLGCARLPATGTAVCDLQRGLVDGVLATVLGVDVSTRETLCWGLGDTVCQFEAYTGAAPGYGYPEDAFPAGEQRRLLDLLAGQAEVAGQNLRLLQERRDHETRDPLTGLLNFRQLRERAAFELARAERHGRAVAFVMLDIDDFRGVNEELGWDGGDEVLKRCAETLAAQLRSCDLLCRYGADEFLIVLPETADPETDVVLQRVMAVVRDLAVDVDAVHVRLTASAGVAGYPVDGRTGEELVAKAATTMYAARAGGAGSIGFYSGPSRP